MPIPYSRLAAALTGLMLCTAGATCTLQAPVLSALPYSAVKTTEGVLSLVISCEPADVATPYTLKISALGGRFDQASGSFVVGARGKANSLLQLQIQGASPALGGTVVPTVYTGSQVLTFPVTIPAGQWQASGSPTISLNFDLSPFATGKTLP